MLRRNDIEVPTERYVHPKVLRCVVPKGEVVQARWSLHLDERV